MSRLYAWIDSDTRKTTLTTQGNKIIKFHVNYGSKENSKLLAQIVISYAEWDFEPKITIHRPEDKTDPTRIEII